MVILIVECLPSKVVGMGTCCLPTDCTPYFERMRCQQLLQRYKALIVECCDPIPEITSLGYEYTRPLCRAKIGPKRKAPQRKEEFDWSKLDEICAQLPNPHKDRVEKPKLNLLQTLKNSCCGEGLIQAIAYGIAKRRGMEGMIPAFLKLLEDRLSPKRTILTHENLAPQMDTEQTRSSQEDKTASATLTTAGECSQSTNPKPKIRGLHSFSSSAEKPVYNTLTERWILDNIITWSVNQSQGTLIYKQALPFNIIKKQLQSQNAQLFLSHAWYRSGVNVKIGLNSNRFQIGAVVVSYLYARDQEGHLQNTLQAALQRDHVVLYAGDSNDGTIEIPYRFVNSMMSMRDNINFGYLLIHVLNPLTTAPTTTSECSLSVYYAFDDAQFHGMVSRIAPQMETIPTLVDAGCKILSTLRADPNRDNPPMPLQPIGVMPFSTGSFCTMDKTTEPIHVLRSDPRGQTPAINTIDDMNAIGVARKWGLLRTYTWTTSQNYRDQIASLNVHPTPENRLNDIPTPLEMVANMYGYWRGDIEYRIELVGNAFYRGRFMVAAIPRTDKDDAVTLDEAKFSQFTTFDVSGTNEFLFTWMWQWENAVCPTRIDADLLDVPASLRLYTVNPLIAIEGVPNQVYLNVYVRAGENFEVSIPRPPILFPKVDRYLEPAGSHLVPYNTETKMWTTYNNSLKAANGKFPLTFYIDSTHLGWVGYTNVAANTIYELTGFTASGLEWRGLWYYKDNAGKEMRAQARYGIYDETLATDSAHGLVLARQLTEAKNFVAALRAGKPYDQARNALGVFWIKDGPVSQIKVDGKWVDAADQRDPPQWKVAVSSLDDSYVLPQMDKPTPTTSMGLQIFGEGAPDLKSITRRWNYFGSVVVPTRAQGLPQDAAYSAMLRVHPFRHIEPSASATYDARRRQGTISAVASMYGFWRGGLRFRFVVQGAPPAGTFCFAAHYFDRMSESSSPIYKNKQTSPISRKDILDTQYATFGHSLSLNQVFSVEVPYYSAREQLSLDSTYSRDMTDNGVVQIWLVSKEQTDVHLEVYYSLADDCRFETFQGCPPCYDITSFADEPIRTSGPIDEDSLITDLSVLDLDNDLLPIEPQMDTIVSSIAKHTMDSIMGPPTEVGVELNEQQAIENIAVLDGETTAPSIQETLAATSEAIQQTCTRITSIADSVKSFATSISANAREGIENMNLSSCFSTLKSEMLIHFVYAVLGRNIPSVAFAVFNIFRILFDWSIDKAVIAVSKIESVLKSMITPTVVPNSDTLDVINSYIAMLYTSITTALRIKNAPANIKGLAHGLFVATDTMKNSRYLTTFIKDNATLLKRIVEYIASLFKPKSNNIDLLVGEGNNVLFTWAQEALFIAQPQNETTVLTRPEWIQKVFALSIQGNALLAGLVRDELATPRLLAYIREVLQGVRKLERKLIEMKVYTSVRYEPYCVWMQGDAGVGKTHLAVEICEELAKFHNYEGANSYHPRTVGQKYMDGYTDQPSIFVDDALAMSCTQDPDFYMFFLQSKSPGSINPPFASVENKATRINFFNYVITSNISHFNGIPGIHNNEAYNRRRDTVLSFRYASVRENGKNVNYNYAKVNAMSSEERAKFNYVDVFILDPLDPTNLGTLIKRVPGENYGITVRNYIMQEARKYHLKESKKYNKLAKKISDRLAQVSASAVSYNECFDAYLSEISKLANDTADPLLVKEWLELSKDAASFPMMPEGQMNTKPITSNKQYLDELFPARTLEGVRVGEATSLFALAPSEEECRSALIPLIKAKCPTCTHHKLLTKVIEYLPKRQSYITMYGDIIPDKDCGKDCMFNKAYTQVMEFWLYNTYRDVAHKVAQGTISCKSKARDIPGLDDANVPPRFKRYLQKRYLDCYAVNVSIEFLEHIRTSIKEQLQKIGSVFVRKTEEAERWLGEHWYVVYDTVLATLVSLCVVATTLFILTSLIAIIRRLFGSSTTTEPNGGPSWIDYDDKQTTKLVGKHRQIVRRFMGDVEGNMAPASVITLDQISDAQLGRTNDQLDSIIQAVRQNTTFIVATKEINGKVYQHSVRCIGLGGKQVLVLKHYIDYFEAEGYSSLLIFTKEGRIRVECKLSDLKFEWSDCGYGIAIIDALPDLYKNITKYMPSSEYAGVIPANLVVLEPWLKHTKLYSVTAKEFEDIVRVPSSSNMQGWDINGGLEYNWGGPGRCGSIILAPTMGSPLIAIHTAGIRNIKGFGEFLCRDSFKVDQERQISYVPVRGEISDTTYMLPGTLEEVKTLTREEMTSAPVKSKIVPSLIHGVFPVLTEPAPLTSIDPRLSEKVDILKIGVAKRCDPILPFPVKHRDIVEEHYNKHYLAKVRPCTAVTSELTQKQAIEGIPDLMTPISMSTSEGMPWTLCRPTGYNSKRWLFQLDQYPSGRLRVQGMYSVLSEVLNVKEKQRKAGLVPASYFTCTLKDARILKEKVAIPGKTRVFEASPIELTIAQRQYFGLNTAAYMESKFEHMIGINVDGPHWSNLAEQLLAFSPYILTADYSGYGPRLSHNLLHDAFKTSQLWYENYGSNQEQNAIVRECIAYEVIHGLHIAKNLVFRPGSGLPSGNVETVTRNSECNSRYIRYAYLGLAAKYTPDIRSLCQFNDHVKMFSYGDDLIIAVKETIIEWFNNTTLIEFFGQYNLTMTDALKSGVSKAHCTIEEATFLKRGFKRHPFRDEWLAPLCDSSVTDCANWITTSIDKESATLVNAEMSCRLAYAHGPDFYKNIVNKIVTALSKIGIIFEAPSWIELDIAIWEQRDKPAFVATRCSDRARVSFGGELQQVLYS